MTYQKGQSGNLKGRPKGSFDRVTVIFDAIRRKIAEAEGKDPREVKDAVAKWLGGLDDKTLALLYAKAMPKDVNMNVSGKLTWAQQIEKMQNLRGEKETPDE